MHNKNKQTQYGMEESESDLVPYTVENKPDKGFLAKHPVVLAGLAAAAVAGAGEAAKVVNNELQQAPSAEHSITAEQPSTPETTDPNLDKRLVYWQANFDGDFKIAPTDIPPSVWQNGPQYAVTIEEGGSIVTDALKAYEKMHHLSGDDEVPANIKDSITITARSFIDRQRAEGGDGVIQPNTVLTLSEITDANNIERAIISNSVVDETNK